MNVVLDAVRLYYFNQFLFKHFTFIVKVTNLKALFKFKIIQWPKALGQHKSYHLHVEAAADKTFTTERIMANQCQLKKARKQSLAESRYLSKASPACDMSQHFNYTGSTRTVCLNKLLLEIYPAKQQNQHHLTYLPPKALWYLGMVDWKKIDGSIEGSTIPKNIIQHTLWTLVRDLKVQKQCMEISDLWE